MAPTTRSTTSDKRKRGVLDRKEYSTPKRARFFAILDAHESPKNVSAAARLANLKISSAHYINKQRAVLGSPAVRRTRKLSSTLGRHPKVSPETYRKLPQPEFNPIRDQTLEAQIEHFDLDIHVRTLQKGLARHTNRAQKYRQAYVSKEISSQNRRKRKQYAQQYQKETIKSHWQFLIFSDEAHFDPGSIGVGHILREHTRVEPENIQERGELAGNSVHWGAWINWHEKAPHLTFYNDDYQAEERPKYPRKPVQHKADSEESYKQRLIQWEVNKPPILEKKPQGNAMTQEYYLHKLLPGLCGAVNSLRDRYKHLPDNWQLVEDGDSSHGLKSGPEGLCNQYRRKHYVRNVDHPPQSPDLNPIEAIWNIIKQRARKHTWRTAEGLKKVLDEEWQMITQAEIQARIAEMPDRCKQVATRSQGPVKSNLW